MKYFISKLFHLLFCRIPVMKGQIVLSRQFLNTDKDTCEQWELKYARIGGNRRIRKKHAALQFQNIVPPVCSGQCSGH